MHRLELLVVDQNLVSYISTTVVSALPLAHSAPPRLNFVVAVHGLQGRLRLAIARPGLGPRGLCPPPDLGGSGGVGRARQPAPVPRTRRRCPHSAYPLRGHARRAPAARLLGAAPSGSLRSHWRRTPPSLLTPRRPFPLWGRQAPAGAPPCAPRHLRRAPGSRRAVEGARYGGPDPEALHSATPYRRRPQGRDVCPHIVSARGARLCDKHNRTPKRPTLLLP